MNLEFSFQIFLILQLIAFCQNSHVQHVKRRLRTILNRARSPEHLHETVPAHYYNHYHGARHVQRIPSWRSSWKQRHKTHERNQYTRWSNWSQCNKDCVKRRERFCRIKRKCGNIKHVEEHKCWNCFSQVVPATKAPEVVAPTLSQSPQVIFINNAATAREHLLPHYAGHLHQPNFSKQKPEGEFENDEHSEEIYDFKHAKRPKSLHSSQDFEYIESDSYEDYDLDISPDIDRFGAEDRHNVSKFRSNPETLSLRQGRIYSKWSRWSKCSPKCTTTRYKKCRSREHCGREVLREISYCYTEGSFCQQWLQTQLQLEKFTPYDMRPYTSQRRAFTGTSGTADIGTSETSLQTNTILGDVILNGKGYSGPEYLPQKLKCGIAPINQNGKRNGRRRNMSNMLKIIGGKASRKGEWPWQVAIFNRFKEAFCGGTLIAPQWVLTAAHCVRKVLYVRIGEHNLDYDDGTELQVRISRSFKHPNFDKRTVDSDVALLKLPSPVNTTNWIGFSCLPRPYQSLPTSVDCTVIGWGKRRNRDVAGTNVLHQADVPIIPMDNCRSVYQDYTITKNMFCAGHKRGRIDTCAGDSGGPLLCRDATKPNHPWTIFGITSFGDGCAKRNKFGIYTKVPNYVDWVWSVINCNGNCKPE